MSAPAIAAAEPLIVVEGLVKRYGAYTAVDGLNLTAFRGEVLGYLGRNGAGKTTTIRCLTGMLKPDAGRALVAGIDPATEPMRVKALIGYVPESGALYDWLSAAEYLQLIGRLHGLDDAVIARRSGEMLSALGLEEKAQERMDSYSKGMRKKVAIAAASSRRIIVLSPGVCKRAIKPKVS
ncbi:MAG: ABC transporter ATP-binding protein [Myxococcales bacterium]